MLMAVGECPSALDVGKQCVLLFSHAQTKGMAVANDPHSIQAFSLCQ